MPRRSLLLAALASCGLLHACGPQMIMFGAFVPSYSRGSVYTEGGAHHTFGCLELNVRAYSTSDPSRPELTFAVGNACDYDVPLDFRALRVVAVPMDAASVDLNLFDPRQEVRPQSMGPLAQGSETLAYSGDVPANSTDLVCVDVAHLAADAPSAVPVVDCFDRAGRVTIAAARTLP